MRSHTVPLIFEFFHKLTVAQGQPSAAAGGVNEDQFRATLDYLFAHEHAVSLMIQPMAFAGRGASLAGKLRRLTIPEVVRLLGETGHPAVCASDFVPLPCSHPHCFSLAFYLMLQDGRAVSVNRLIRADELLDSVSNRVIFGLQPSEYEQLKRMSVTTPSGSASRSEMLRSSTAGSDDVARWPGVVLWCRP